MSHNFTSNSKLHYKIKFSVRFLHFFAAFFPAAILTWFELFWTFSEENSQTAAGAAGAQKKIRPKEDNFNFHDEDMLIYNNSLEDIERKLFGIVSQNNLEQEISTKDFIPIRTGTGAKFMKNGPKHIMDAEDLEPLYSPQENILEECLRREAERVAH